MNERLEVGKDGPLFSAFLRSTDYKAVRRALTEKGREHDQDGVLRDVYKALSEAKATPRTRSPILLDEFSPLLKGAHWDPFEKPRVEMPGQCVSTDPPPESRRLRVGGTGLILSEFVVSLGACPPDTLGAAGCVGRARSPSAALTAQAFANHATCQR